MNTGDFIKRQFKKFLDQEERHAAAQPHPLDVWMNKEYPDIPENRVAVGMTRIRYHRLCRNLFRITLKGDVRQEDYQFGFKAHHLFWQFWWVDLKGFNAKVKQSDEFNRRFGIGNSIQYAPKQ